MLLLDCPTTVVHEQMLHYQSEIPSILHKGLVTKPQSRQSQVVQIDYRLSKIRVYYFTRVKKYGFICTIKDKVQMIQSGNQIRMKFLLCVHQQLKLQKQIDLIWKLTPTVTQQLQPQLPKSQNIEIKSDLIIRFILTYKNNKLKWTWLNYKPQWLLVVTYLISKLSLLI